MVLFVSRFPHDFDSGVLISFGFLVLISFPHPDSPKLGKFPFVRRVIIGMEGNHVCLDRYGCISHLAFIDAWRGYRAGRGNLLNSLWLANADGPCAWPQDTRERILFYVYPVDIITKVAALESRAARLERLSRDDFKFKTLSS